MENVTREDWARSLLDYHLRDYFAEHGYTIPDNLRIGFGFPSRSALSTKKRRIGEAWSPSCSGDECHEVIISLTLDDPLKVIGVIVHELVHACVGVEHGHRKPFSQCAKAVGLVKPWTSTSESDALKEHAAAWLESVGPYPHKALDKSSAKKQTTRMILLECGCGLKVRTTQKWIDEYGPTWVCPCGGQLVLQ